MCVRSRRKLKKAEKQRKKKCFIFPFSKNVQKKLKCKAQFNEHFWSKLWLCVCVSFSVTNGRQSHFFFFFFESSVSKGAKAVTRKGKKEKKKKLIVII